MLRAWKEVARIAAMEATHRRGFKLTKVSDEFILEGAVAELDELRDTPNNPMELADVFGCLIHYAIKKEWPMELIEECLLEKLAARFKFKEPLETNERQRDN